MDRLLLTLGIIFVSLVSGYALQKGVTGGRVKLSPEAFVTLRLRMQRFALFGLIPLSAMLSLWGLPSPDPRLLALPLFGLCAWILGGALAVLASAWLRLDRPQTGSLYCCGSFTNIGAVGALVCVVFLGENTIALVSLYRLCEELFYFGVAFPVARWYGTAGQGERLSFRRLRIDPILRVVLCALLLGIGLNLTGVPRPAVAGPLASGAMILSTVLFLSAIGMSLRVSRMLCYTRQSLAVAVIKFVLVPVAITGLAWAAGYGGLDGGLPLRVVAALSCMPVAMNALVPPSLFGLDLDLANACWVYTTTALIVVLPVLMLILPLL